MFVEKFQNYFDKSSDYKRKLIYWCCIDNQECNIDNFNLIYDTIEVHNKSAFKSNYFGNRGGNKKLKEITDEDITYLDSTIDELDGTLLVDVVSRFMTNYKIFI